METSKPISILLWRPLEIFANAQVPNPGSTVPPVLYILLFFPVQTHPLHCRAID